MKNYLLFSGTECSVEQIEKLKVEKDFLSPQMIMEEEHVILNNPTPCQNSAEVQQKIKDLMQTQKIVVLVNLDSGKVFLYKGPDAESFRQRFLNKLSYIYDYIFRQGRLPLREIIDLRRGKMFYCGSSLNWNSRAGWVFSTCFFC